MPMPPADQLSRISGDGAEKGRYTKLRPRSCAGCRVKGLICDTPTSRVRTPTSLVIQPWAPSCAELLRTLLFLSRVSDGTFSIGF